MYTSASDFVPAAFPDIEVANKEKAQIDTTIALAALKAGELSIATEFSRSAMDFNQELANDVLGQVVDEAAEVIVEKFEGFADLQ